MNHEFDVLSLELAMRLSLLLLRLPESAADALCVSAK